ncbi:MAG: ATP-binding protein [Bacteroidota bacterium]
MSFRLKDVRISLQMQIGFFILVVLVVVLGTVSYYQTYKIKEQIEEFYDHPFKVRGVIQTLETDVLEARIAERNLYLAVSESEKQMAIKSLKLASDSIQPQFDKLFTVYLGRPADIEEAHQAYKKWKALLDENIHLARLGHTDSAKMNILSLGHITHYREQMMRKMAVIENSAQNSATELYEKAHTYSKTLNIQLLVMIVVIFLISVIINILLYRNVKGPIEILTMATQQFRVGIKNTRSTYESKNEFGHLSTSFNKMIDQVNFESREKDRRAEELMIVNKELETFSYSVSHDLRAPLRHINGYVDLLLSRYHDTLPDKAKHYLDNIANSSGHMGMLIDNLLQFSRIGRQEMQKIDMDMNAAVSEIIKQLKQDNHKRDIEWHLARLPRITCDPALVRLVWVNLLSNAVKFTAPREKAVITLTAVEQDNEYVFTVADNGVGFDMQYANKLFGVFQRLHPPDKFEGTGIGLANVQHIISRHGGRTWAEAELDNGATFHFTLPKS